MKAPVRTLRTVTFGFVALLLGACATPIKSTIDQAANTDFSAYDTYAWISEEPYVSATAGSQLASSLNHQRVRNSIEQELKAKGYRKVDAAEADFVLGFSLGTRDRVRVQHYYDTFGYYYAYPGRFSRFGSINRFGFGGGFPAVTQSIQTITEGTLAVDVFDNQSREAIWHGMATKSLTGDPNGAALIAEAVAALIGPLPDSMMIASIDGGDAASHDMTM